MLNRNPQLLKYDNGADQTNLRKADILNITIAIPAVKEQREKLSVKFLTASILSAMTCPQVFQQKSKRVKNNTNITEINCYPLKKIQNSRKECDYMPYFNIVAETNENTVVTEYEPVKRSTLIAIRARRNLKRSLSVCFVSRDMNICHIHTEEDLDSRICVPSWKN